MASRQERSPKVPALTPEPRVGVGKHKGTGPLNPNAEMLEQAVKNAEKLPRRHTPRPDSRK
jgi:hypothetical protein